MKKHIHMHYPYVISGKGYGIIEDMSPHDLLNIIKEAMINAILEEFILIKLHKKLLIGGKQ